MYLISAAIDRAICGGGGAFRWYHDGLHHEIPLGDFATAAEVGNMLWRENIASVSHRYPGESSDTLPGPIDCDFVIEGSDIPVFHPPIKPVEVLKACKCYEYQSCEHGEAWEQSSAKAFIDSLKEDAIRALPGYEQAAWGPPENWPAQKREVLS